MTDEAVTSGNTMGLQPPVGRSVDAIQSTESLTSFSVGINTNKLFTQTLMEVDVHRGQVHTDWPIH